MTKRKEKYTRKAGIKGVHPSSRYTASLGQSFAGASMRIKLKAVYLHQRVLDELSNQPKPNLP